MTLDDLELLQGQILSEFREIFRVSEAITAKRMKRTYRPAPILSTTEL